MHNYRALPLTNCASLASRYRFYQDTNVRSIYPLSLMKLPHAVSPKSKLWLRVRFVHETPSLWRYLVKPFLTDGLNSKAKRGRASPPTARCDLRSRTKLMMWLSGSALRFDVPFSRQPAPAASVVEPNLSSDERQPHDRSQAQQDYEGPRRLPEPVSGQALFGSGAGCAEGCQLLGGHRCLTSDRQASARRGRKE